MGISGVFGVGEFRVGRDVEVRGFLFELLVCFFCLLVFFEYSEVIVEMDD